jgi:hypothetical protein
MSIEWTYASITDCHSNICSLLWIVGVPAYSRSRDNSQMSNVELRTAMGAGERTSVTVRKPGEPRWPIHQN